MCVYIYIYICMYVCVCICVYFFHIGALIVSTTLNGVGAGCMLPGGAVGLTFRRSGRPEFIKFLFTLVNLV